jgi:hypothetical protein
MPTPRLCRREAAPFLFPNGDQLAAGQQNRVAILSWVPNTEKPSSLKGLKQTLQLPDPALTCLREKV